MVWCGRRQQLRTGKTKEGVIISCIEALEGPSKDDGMIDGRGVEGRLKANWSEDREI